MPGATQFTRTPYRPSSAASARATASTAPFAPDVPHREAAGGDGRHGDDVAPALAQQRQRGMHQVEERNGIAFELGAVLARRHLAQVPHRHVRARRVHEGVDATDHLGHGLGCSGLVGQVQP